MRTVPIGRRAVHALLGAIVLSMLLAPASGATLGSPTGSCSKDSRWNLSLVKEEREISLTFRLRTGHPLKRWRLRLRHDGELAFRIIRRTNAAGTLRVVRSIPNLPGVDHLLLTGRNLQGVETCRIKASI